MRIDFVLVLSTAHLKPETSAGLQAATDNDTPANHWTLGIVVEDHEWGHWVHVSPDYELAFFPEDIAQCLNFAKQARCNWIRFDRDEPEIDELPVYDW